MATDRKAEAALALHRFGFGPMRDWMVAIAHDPRGALIADLERPMAGAVSVKLPSSAEAARLVADYRAEQQAKQKLAQRVLREAQSKGAMAPGTQNSDSPNATRSASAGSGPKAAEKPAEKPADNQPPMPNRIFQNEAQARLDAALGAEVGFVERLVWFWSNHFCVSADKDIATPGAYEREAIRPHVLGHFSDLLLAVESHPAMLTYLDNTESMGPDSINGINRDRGLNENLAREILELHTLGVRSGYTQADVTSFANVLTGWSWIEPGEPLHGGEFVFVKRRHEPSEQAVLGKHYPDIGVGQGRAVLIDLARHPATAHHIAFKLARHFIADEPPPGLVAKLAKTFVATDGNLKEVAKTLVTADESWTPLRAKLKRPSQWIAAALRLTGVSWTAQRVTGAQHALGEPLWRPPAPNGFADTEAAWIDGIGQRLQIAFDLAGALPPGAEPTDLLELALGPLASADTRNAVTRAGSRRQALALLAMAPEFLRS
jgi:uncharacterized protein (DUF1800 family)